MENATKALLIAGSVLIAIVLIAVGIKILSSTSGITNEVEGLSTTMEASIFNSQFTQYEGTKKGSEVSELIRLIKLNNTRNSDKQISGIEGITIDVSKKYNVSFPDISAKGYITKVQIEEVN